MNAYHGEAIIQTFWKLIVYSKLLTKENKHSLHVGAWALEAHKDTS